MQDPDRLEVELVRVHVGFDHAEVVKDIGEPAGARPDRPPQAQPHGVRDLCPQVFGWLAEERECAVEEGGMLDAVFGESLEAAAEPLAGVLSLLVDGVEQSVDLG
ncbi:MAG: hypothetical protein M3076_14575 [Actinomycetota bacterium]|nr:hypothetical protein [Actinomycetota bacterium]